MMRKILVSLILMAASQATAFDFSGTLSDGATDGEDITSANVNEIDTALDGVQTATSGLDKSWCASGSPLQIGATDAYACLAEYDAAFDYSSLIEIRINPTRSATADPEIGDDIEAAIEACVDPASALNFDYNGTGRLGCVIRVPVGAYAEQNPRRFNVGTVTGDFFGGIFIDLRGSTVYNNIPAPDDATTTISNPSDDRGTCNEANFGRLVVVSDAVDQWDASVGGGAVSTANFCDGENWVAGYQMWTLGGPAAGSLANVDIDLPSFILDDEATDDREIAQRVFVVSAVIGGTAPRDNGGIAQVRFRGGSARGSADRYGTVLDIGGPLGGEGGPQAAGSESCEGITIDGFDADFVSDSAPAIWVRNCADVSLRASHTEHGGILRIGEDQTSETLPEGVSVISHHGGGCDTGPCFQLLSGQASVIGGRMQGDKDASDAGDIARIGGVNSAGVILTSEGTLWRSESANDGQIFLGNISSWTQRGGSFLMADGNTTAGTNPMILADSGADINRLDIQAFHTNFGSVTGGDFIDLSARTTGSDVAICVDHYADPVMAGIGCVASDSVVLGTDTTGNYAGSSSEGGAATTATALAANGGNCLAGNFPLGVDASGASESCTDVVLPAEVSAYTVGTSAPTDGSTACTEGDMYLDESANKIYFCVDSATDDWFGVAITDTP